MKGHALMMFVEVFAPKGSLEDRQRRQIAERLVGDVMNAPDAPRSVIEAGQQICQVVIHEPESWAVGGRQISSEETPRFVIRASMPAGWASEMSTHLISRFTAILADLAGDSSRLYDEPLAWVHVVGLPDGCFGTMGQAMTSNDVVRLITRAYREAPDREQVEPPAGKLIDPICGMSVPLNEQAITLEHDGTLYAFCSHGCRAVFAEDREIAATR